MASFSGSASYLPADNSKPSWTWLQNRVIQKAETRDFSQWLDGRLDELERDYASLMTEDSRQAAESGRCRQRRHQSDDV